MSATAHSVVVASPRAKAIAGALVILYALIALSPLLWIGATAFKSPEDAIAYPPKVFFTPSLEGYVNLFTVQHASRRRNSSPRSLRPRLGTPGWCARETW